MTWRKISATGLLSCLAMAFLAAAALGAGSSVPRLRDGGGSPSPRKLHPVAPKQVHLTGTMRDAFPYSKTVDEVEFADPDAPIPILNSPNPAHPAHPNHVGMLGVDREMNSSGADVRAGSCQSETDIAAWGPYLVGCWNDGETFGAPPGGTGYAYSNDGGNTWVDGGSPPILAATDLTYGDPVLTVDDQGNFYLSALYAPGGVFTTTGGIPNIAVWHGRFVAGVLVWDPPVMAATTATDFFDKEWIAADKECGYLYMSYTRFNLPFPSVTDRQCEFVRSFDGGLTWSAPVVLSDPNEEYMQGSRPSVGPDHEIYVVYESYDNSTGETHQRVQRSLDRGTTWGPRVNVEGPGNQFYENNTSPTGYNRTSIAQFPSIDVDRSCGGRRGRVYVSWSESVDYYDDPLQTGANVAEANDVANNAPGGAQAIAIGSHILGTVSAAGNNDFYSFQGIAGQTYEFTVFPGAGSNADNFLRLFCCAGNINTDMLAFSYFGGGVAQIVWTVPANGQYYIRVRPNSFAGGVQTYDLYTGIHVARPQDVARDHRDAMVSYSDDGGLTWSPRRVVNDDARLFDNTFPEVDVDQAGRVHFQWYDRRNDAAKGILADQRYVRSMDGTSTFLPSQQINIGPSINWIQPLTNLQPNFGDYSGACVDGVNYYASWADGRLGTPDAWMAQVTGGISLYCPPHCEPDTICPCEAVERSYRLCNNNTFTVFVQYNISSGLGLPGCDVSGLAGIPPGECINIPYSCLSLLTPNCAAFDFCLNAQFIETDASGEAVDTLCCTECIHVKRGATAEVHCPPNQTVMGGTLYDLAFYSCNTGECPDTILCSLTDASGWLVGGPYFGKKYLLPGECDTLHAQFQVPAGCQPPAADAITWSCRPECNAACGTTCTTALYCIGITPVAVSNVVAEAREGAVQVSWTSYVQGQAARFQVLRGLASDASFVAVSGEISGAEGTGMSFRDATALPGTEYLYKVGYRQGGDWTYTNVVRVKTPAAVFALRAARPNPFNRITNLEFEIDRAGEARLEVYNLAGQRVRTLLARHVEPGLGNATWDGRADSGDRLAAGSYFARLVSGNRVLTQRITLLR